MEVISHWHPNITINIVDDHTPWVKGSVPPPLDQCKPSQKPKVLSSSTPSLTLVVIRSPDHAVPLPSGASLILIMGKAWPLQGMTCRLSLSVGLHLVSYYFIELGVHDF